MRHHLDGRDRYSQKLYRFRYMDTIYERVATCGGQDSELTGNEHDVERSYFVITHNPSFAKLAWEQDMSHFTSRLVSQEPEDVTPWKPSEGMRVLL